VVAKEHAAAMGHWVGELELRTMQITLLNEMSGLLQCAENTEEAYAVVGQSVNKLFADARAGAVFIYKPLSNALELTASWGKVTSGKPVLRVTTAGLCAWQTALERVFQPGDCL